MLTAEQKIRQQLAGDPHKEPHFQHEGEEVVRWITGGTMPDVYVIFHQQGTMIEVLCPKCQARFGRFNANYSGASLQLAAIRLVGHEHNCYTGA